MNTSNFIYTKQELCAGCNKCIFICPTKASEAFLEADENKVFIRDGYCISCGECIKICDHSARDYRDDLDVFLRDVKNGEAISVVIAPAAKLNFKNLDNIIGFLKSIGVKNVYDVSLGADICTWAHAKAIREQNLTSIISQPCPVVVSYIEKFHKELIEYLSPIHSPVLCTSIYLKKYLGITDKIMFLSPCIEKKQECIDPNTKGLLEYNITFEKLAEYIKNEDVDLDSIPKGSFDNIEGSLGFTFPRPGGLSENIKFHLGEDIWIKEIEGIFNIEEYLKEYLEDLKEGRPVPKIIDALNCEYGCNLGTGSLGNVRHNEIDYILNSQKKQVTREGLEKLVEYFDKTFDIYDFVRNYNSYEMDNIEVSDEALEEVFMTLGKFTEEDRNVNCFSCGYGNCTEFATAMAQGHNHKNNCKYYLLNKFKQLSSIDDLTGLQNRYSYSHAIEEYRKNHGGFIGILFLDINGLKEANDVKGHAFGDKLIITCARLIKQVFGENTYRYGGDEFIILDDSSDFDKFINKVNNLKNIIEDDEYLVASTGYAISHSAEDLDEKIALADQNMYDAKQRYYQRIKKADRRHST